MTHSVSLRIFAAVLIAVVFGSLRPDAVRAQQTPVPVEPPQGIETSNYLFNLGLTAGYRSATLTNADGTVDPWAEKRYNEAFNLQKGINLNSFNLYGQKTGTQGFFDELFVNASGINDPFTSGSLRMRSFNSYDLKVDFHQSKYYLNRNDSLLSGLHKFDFTRSRLSASLDVNASDNVKVNAQFNTNSRSGDATLTHLGEGFGPAAEAGTSGMIYWLNIPRNDKTTDFNGSLSWKADPTTTLTVGGGMRMYTQELSGSPLNDTSLTFQNFGAAYDPTNPQKLNITDIYGPVGIDGIRGGYIPPNLRANAIYGTNQALSAANFLPLTNLVYSENRDSKTPYFLFEASSRPADMLDVTANVGWESTTLDNPSYSLVQSGIGGSNSYTDSKKVIHYGVFDSAYTDASSTTAMALKKSSLNGALNLTGRIMDELSITARGQYTKTTEEGSQTMLYHLLLGTGLGKQFSDTSWTTATNYATSRVEGEGFLSYAPIEMLALKAGVRFSSLTPTITLNTPQTNTTDSLTDYYLNEKTTSMTPYFNFNFRPSKDYRIDGRYGHTTNTSKDLNGNDVDMLVRTLPKSQDNYSFGVQGMPISHLNASLRYSANVGKSTLLAKSLKNGQDGNEVRRNINLTERPYENSNNSLSASLSYSMSNTMSMTLSGDYRTNRYNIPVTWGTIGLTTGNVMTTGTTLAPQALYGDSGTFLIQQNTIDRFLDLTVQAQPIAALHLEAGFALTSSSGGVQLDSSMRVLYNKDSISPTLNPHGVYQDRTLYGGPYSSYQAHVGVAYDVTANVGIMADYQLVYYKEDQVSWADYFALNNYRASLFRGGFALKF
jgi:hypothetical protein